jgi:hypothetical protein
VKNQFSRYNLLKKLFLVHGFGSFVKDLIDAVLWIYFWVFNSIPLVCISVFGQYHTVFVTMILQYFLKSGLLMKSSSYIITLCSSYHGLSLYAKGCWTILVSGMKPTWSLCMIFYTCGWIQLASILLRIYNNHSGKKFGGYLKS